MSRELFGTDGVRGLAGEYPLDEQGSRQIGRAVGELFGDSGKTILVGGDTRESTPAIVASLSQGLNDVGVSVVQVGVLATPGLAYLVREHDEFAAGVMVTASHNPYQYNGIKVFDVSGGKLSDEVEAQLNKLVDSDISEHESAGSITVNESLRSEYEQFLVSSAGSVTFDKLKLAVDTANGATSTYAASIFERLGAEVTSLHNEPNGTNINQACGATDTRALQQAVSANSLDMGIAFDGDADRLIMVDDKGREVKGDYLMYILAVTLQAKGVVATVMSNMGFEQALVSKGIALDRRDVGDRYVIEGLQQTGYPIGGEQSGHIILPALLDTGDGLLAAIQVVAAVRASGKSLADWCDEVTLLPQALVNIDLGNRALLQRPSVVTYIESQNQQFAGKGRLLIRPSGTEPLARVMVEADNAEAEANRIAQELSALLRNESREEPA